MSREGPRPSEAQSSSQGTSAEGELRRVVKDTLLRAPAHTNACSHPPRLPRDACPAPIRSQRPPARRPRHGPSGTAGGGGGGALPGPPSLPPPPPAPHPTRARFSRRSRPHLPGPDTGLRYAVMEAEPREAESGGSQGHPAAPGPRLGPPLPCRPGECPRASSPPRAPLRRPVPAVLTWPAGRAREPRTRAGRLFVSKFAFL